MKLILLMAALLLALTSCAADPGGAAEYRQVGMDEAIAMMESEEDYVILDVRTQAEFDQAHIPGALCLPNENIGSQKPGMLPDTDQLILVYCRSGNRSKQASQKLAQLGYTNVVEFGGIIDWPGEIVTD